MAAVARPPHERNRPRSSGVDGSKGIWSSMLDSVSTRKGLSEKVLLILGGTVEAQRSFLEALSPSDQQQRRRGPNARKEAPLANRFALGYTYQDLLDVDQDDILARISEYTLADSNPAFRPLIKPLFNPKSVPDMAVVILLDWAEPWNWLRQLRDWIRILKSAVNATDDETKEVMEENVKDWQQKRKGTHVEQSSSVGVTANTNDLENTLPVQLAPGEWDEPLGVPLCVVCQNAEKIEILEREHRWGNHEFDTIFLYLRTILLKHGASLIYTASSAPGSLQMLVRSSLDIHSLLQRNPLKYNVTDRDKALVPSNWDSWGKIRLLREGFDLEKLSDGWSIDIQIPTQSANGQIMEDRDETSNEYSAVSAYESEIRDPAKRNEGEIGSQNNSKPSDEIEVKCPDNQDFFAEQLEALEQFKKEDEQAAKKAKDARKASSSQPGQGREESRVSEHIGPVQFNMGGIQVDADEMLKSLKDREAGRTTHEDSSSPAATPEGKADNEHLRSFFASLASRGSNSASNSPKQ